MTSELPHSPDGVTQEQLKEAFEILHREELRRIVRTQWTIRILSILFWTGVGVGVGYVLFDDSAKVDEPEATALNAAADQTAGGSEVLKDAPTETPAKAEQQTTPSDKFRNIGAADAQQKNRQPNADESVAEKKRCQRALAAQKRFDEIYDSEGQKKAFEDAGGEENAIAASKTAIACKELGLID
jgi:hypothetical protein